jgi:hypothetical protein
MSESPGCRDLPGYNQAVSRIEEFFQQNPVELLNIRELAKNISRRISGISPFIQRATENTCPACKDVCCISRHGYYNYEDLVYIRALGLTPPRPDFGSNDFAPCRFLAAQGCSMERCLRPSGCNWYFCEALFNYMETLPGYQEFDDSLTEIAELWLKMMEEFRIT